MTVRITVGNLPDPTRPNPSKRTVRAPLHEGTLESLFRTLAKRHPDLAPLLEDATHQEDLEIFVNDLRVDPAQGASYALHDGDSVSLFVKRP